MADDDVERALREAMAHRTAGTTAPPDLSARVRQGHRHRRQRLAALTTATVAVTLVSATVAYQGFTHGHSTATGKATSTPYTSSLCAGLPTTPQLTDSEYYRQHPTPPAGLRIDYLPPTVGKGPQGPWATSALKGDFWYYGYGWSWLASEHGVRGPEIAVQVVCGTAANSLDGLQIVSDGFQAETPERIRGMRAYEGTCRKQPVAFLLVADGLAVEVSVTQLARAELGKVLRGIHVTGK